MSPDAKDADPGSGVDHDEQVAGCEWIVDAQGCGFSQLRSLEHLRLVCGRVIEELELCVVGAPLWHQFPEPGGVTGLYLLSESHLACHTWPERGLATFNLFCCRRRREWAWELHLKQLLLAEQVSVRVIERGVGISAVAPLCPAGGVK
jgi:S-adenosylmethionine decarboxylase